jgi:hypothetical protein
MSSEPTFEQEVYINLRLRFLRNFRDSNQLFAFLAVLFDRLGCWFLLLFACGVDFGVIDVGEELSKCLDELGIFLKRYKV